MALPIEDYAVIGDTETAALVGRDGSVDWMCLPRFDSPACFAALLGEERHGRWLIGPAVGATTTRRYLGRTFVLETTHETETGVVTVTDLMPALDKRADMVRIVRGVKGTVSMRHEWIVRFGYGKIRPWVTRRQDEAGEDIIRAVAGPEMLVLRGTRLPKAKDGMHVDEFDVSEGETYRFSTTWMHSYHPVPPMLDIDKQLEDSRAWGEDWAKRCTYAGAFEEHVVRSLLVLRILTHSETGGIVAAATTSLPEDFGGVRNWDYRYCWLRDASLTLDSLLRSGFTDEARLWRDWLIRALAGDPQDLQIMYGVDGSRDLPERELAHLPGYAGSQPVRIGNGAVDQRQTDVLGEVMAALGMARDHDGGHPDHDAGSKVGWALQRALISDLADRWQEPDNGLWEIRGPQRHFTHSRAMVWVAFHEMVRAAEAYNLRGPVDKWRQIRDTVRAEILERGFDAQRNSFVQHYDTEDVDASLLLLSAVGFLDGDDPRILGTIQAVENDLLRDGLVLRYRTQSGVDGLPGDEHPFLACSFWLVIAYARAGRLDDARRYMSDLVALCNDVGLLAEEYDPANGRMVGNFPQAFSHLALVRAAIAIAKAEDRGGKPAKAVD